MALTLNGTTGISGVNGSASAPSVVGSDSNTGVAFASDTVLFSTGGSERARIDSSGDLLLGKVSSDVNSTGVELKANGQSKFTRSSGTPVVVNRNTNNGICVLFSRSGTGVGSVTVTTSSTAFNTSSDYRLKENVVAISDGITRLKTLKPYRFNFKANPTTTVDGFLAHEVTAVPEAITGTKDEVDSDNNPVYQGIDQSKLVPLLTAALQEAVAKIETLETKVAALEAA
tara:strand:- start:2794 stop:3480 length:687 start_codon:yes stop_codon:yes gene_type:complete